MATRKSLQSLPEDKQQQLAQLTQLILNYPAKAKIHFITLFGSYSRGDWVEDFYIEDGITYSYQSDFDILVIVDNCAIEVQRQIETNLSQQVHSDHHIKVPVSFIVEDIATINEQLSQHHYFFSDIEQEGIQLYNSDEQQLAKMIPLKSQDRYLCAVDNFKQWNEKSTESLAGVDFYIGRNNLNFAAFLLHRATESVYYATLLVYTHYKPKTHALEELRQRTNSLESELIKTFPLATRHERELFTLLCRAYVDARYKKDYRITVPQLQQLRQQVLGLQQAVKQFCTKKIAALKADAGL